MSVWLASVVCAAAVQRVWPLVGCKSCSSVFKPSGIQAIREQAAGTRVIQQAAGSQMEGLLQPEATMPIPLRLCCCHDMCLAVPTGPPAMM